MPRNRRLRPNWPYLAACLVACLLLSLFVIWRSSTVHYRDASDADWQLAVVASSIEAVVAVWFLATGAAIGSFLNVVAWRIPRGITLIGPSRCPHCTTKLSLTDNFPIFGWLSLRGRCRTCRLPISPRYFWAELIVMIVFGWTYFNEFLSLGANLPTQPFKQSMSLESRLLKTTFAVQLSLYLWVLSGLIASAIIAIQKNLVPLKVYFWSFVPCVAVPMVAPSVIQVPWWSSVQVTHEGRLDSFLTVLCGAVAGVVVAQLVSRCSPYLNNGTEPGQLGSNKKYLANSLVGGFGVAGALLGWQAVFVVALISAILALITKLLLAVLKLRPSGFNLVGSLSCWVWLAVLIYRSTWVYWT